MANRVILLDSTPLGLVTHPNPGLQALACKHWLQAQMQCGSQIIVPEIVDYELRRELLRANGQRGLANLATLLRRVKYLPLSTAAMRQAAQFWAQARQQGQPTAGDKNIDADVILAAQAATLGDPTVIVATDNVRHLARFVPADKWENIT